VSPARIHPIDIAAETALLAALAPGRVYVGLARGAWLAEHGLREPERPVRAIRETVDILRYLLSGDTGGYDGQVFRLAPHVRAPYPLPTRLPPVLIGTWGRHLAALAGAIADEVKVGGSANPDLVPVMAGYVAAGERDAGRAPGTVGLVFGAVTVVADDRAAARARARRSVALYLPVVAALDPTLQVAPDLIARLRLHARQQAWDDAAGLIADDLLDRFAFAGDARDVIGQAERLFAAGARRVEFGTPHGLRAETGIRLLGETVLPALKG
jgi:5,10-methylenetetrahydromethanopterin reductase